MYKMRVYWDLLETCEKSWTRKATHDETLRGTKAAGSQQLDATFKELPALCCDLKDNNDNLLAFPKGLFKTNLQILKLYLIKSLELEF